MSEFGAVDMDVTNIVRLEPLAFFRSLAGREAGDAVALKAAMQGASAQVWNSVLRAAEDVIQRQERPAPELDDGGFLGRGQDRAFRLWSHGIGGLATIAPLQDSFDIKTYWVARRRAGAFAALSSARIRGVVWALP
jgi:hypothetical protein